MTIIIATAWTLFLAAWIAAIHWMIVWSPLGWKFNVPPHLRAARQLQARVIAVIFCIALVLFLVGALPTP